jgi:hypothetical protein
VAAALGTTPAARAIVQDYNRARGADGYTLTNSAGDLSGTFDGQEFQPAPSSPGISGEFWFAGAGLGQPFDLDVRAPLGQGVTNTPNDHGGYMLVDYKGAAGGPFYWYGGAGNTVGPFPGIKIIGGGTPPVVPPLSQMIAYADVLAPAGKPFRYYINSPYDGQDHQLSFSGTGTGAWQTVGGSLNTATAIGGGVIYANAPFDTPNTVAMTVQFGAPEIVVWDNGPGGPAVLRFDNFTLTIAAATWAGTSGGNWSADSNWAPVGGANPTAPSGRNAVATFGPSASPQTVSLDSPVLTPWTPSGGGDYPTTNNFYVGTLIFDSAQPYTLAGPEPLHIDTTAANGTNLAGPGGTIQVVNGSHTISAPVILARSTTLDVAASSTLTITGPLTVFASDGQPVTLAKASAGTAIVKNIRVTGSLDVSGGTLRVAPDSTAAGVSFVPGPITIAGRLDLTNNKLITQNPVGSATGGTYNGISGLIQSGRNGGGWGGSGIVTSQTSATTSNLTSIGIASASEAKGIAPGATAVWAGQTVTGTDTLVMYTYGGDANLDGKLNVDDYGRIDSNIGLGPAGWYNGDFNYDGKVNVDDYGVIDSNIGIQGSPFFTATAATPSIAGLAAVPEPASCAILTLGIAALLSRRRCRRRRDS